MEIKGSKLLEDLHVSGEQLLIIRDALGWVKKDSENDGEAPHPQIIVAIRLVNDIINRHIQEE